MKPRKPGDKKRYTVDERMEILRLVKKNNYCIYKTETEIKEKTGTAPCYKTIKGWMEKYSDVLAEKENTKDIIKRLEGDDTQSNEELNKLHYKAEKIGIERLIELLPQSKDIRAIIDVVVHVRKIRNDNLGPDGDVTINYFQQLNQKLIQKSNEED